MPDLTKDDVAHLLKLEAMLTMRIDYYRRTTTRTGTVNELIAERAVVRKVVDANERKEKT